jgi:hypothetical protein
MILSHDANPGRIEFSETTGSVDDEGEKKRKHMSARTKKGRRTTGHDAVATIRLSSELRENVDAWAAKQSDKPARPEAILRLVELRLETTHRRESTPNRAAKASEMAAQEIDRISDPSATEEERQLRKRRLIKGPKEFREIRKKSREIDSDGPIFSQWGSSHSPNTRTPPDSQGRGLGNPQGYFLPTRRL